MRKSKCEICEQMKECRFLPHLPGSPDHGSMAICLECMPTQVPALDVQRIWATCEPCPEEEYGRCKVCWKPFKFQDERIDISLCGCGVSQGYATVWEGKKINVCLRCFNETTNGKLVAHLRGEA